MSVMVQSIVKVSDVDRFVTTSEKFAPMMEEMGGRNGGVYEDENDPGLVSTISEWENHDQMHEASEKWVMTSGGKRYPAKADRGARRQEGIGEIS